MFQIILNRTGIKTWIYYPDFSRLQWSWSWNLCTNRTRIYKRRDATNRLSHHAAEQDQNRDRAEYPLNKTTHRETERRSFTGQACDQPAAVTVSARPSPGGGGGAQRRHTLPRRSLITAVRLDLIASFALPMTCDEMGATTTCGIRRHAQSEQKTISVLFPSTLCFKNVVSSFLQ